MTITPGLLAAALQAVCPIDGVAGPINPPSPWTLYPASDGTLWRIDFRPEATDAQRQAAAQALASYVDAPTAPTVTGNQWAFALSTLGLSAAWQVGVAKSKSSDQVRIGLIARDTALLAADPLLIRVAVNAGTDASGNALVAVPAVFTAAQGMPL